MNVDDKTVRRFKRVRISLMRHPKFAELGPVMMVGKRELTSIIGTACTNGRDEMYNPEFIFQWSDKEAGFIIIHENMHKAARHMDVYSMLYKINPQIANMACDYWINQNIVAADPHEEIVAMPKEPNGKPIGCLDFKYKGWTVKRIFDDLMANPPDGGEDGEDGEGGERRGGGGLDDHDWEGAKEMTADEKEELKQDIERAIREGIAAAKKAGAGRGNSQLGLDDIITPKVSWVEQLRDFIRATCKKKEHSTWRRFNRRHLANGMVLPTMEGNSIRELVAAPDASGSMHFGVGQTPFQKCMAEIEGLVVQLNIEKLHLIYWDGYVTRHEEYTPATISNWKNISRPCGGGGTDPSCVPAYLKEKGIKPDAVIMLTDGEVPGWGVWSCPVLWGISNTSKITAGVGKTIHID